MGRLIALISALVLLWSPATMAQGIGPDDAVRNALRLPSETARHVTDITTTVVVGASFALPCLKDRTWTCVGNEALQVGTMELSTWIMKKVLHRTRPDGSSDDSFWSGHTALACVTTMRTGAWEICPAVALGRIIADRHWLTDTAGGAAAAAVIRWNIHPF